MSAAATMRSIALCAAVAAALVSAAARAQSFPAKPIRIIAPYTAGGAADLLSRFLCEKFPAAMGQPCVVENKPGAGGIIGFDLVAKSEPDGHTPRALVSDGLRAGRGRPDGVHHHVVLAGQAQAGRSGAQALGGGKPGR